MAGLCKRGLGAKTLRVLQFLLAPVLVASAVSAQDTVPPDDRRGPQGIESNPANRPDML